MIITYKSLVESGASVDQIVKFQELFPDGFEINRENIKKALDANFNVDWWATHFLNESELAEYEKTRKALFAEHEKICDAAFNDYEKICSEAYAKFNEACAEAWREYRKVEKAAWADYQKKCAGAFLEVVEGKRK